MATRTTRVVRYVTDVMDHWLAQFTPNTFVGNHDVTRIASLIGSDGAVMALAILLTLGGSP